MSIFEICFILYFLKLSAFRGFLLFALDGKYMQWIHHQALLWLL